MDHIQSKQGAVEISLDPEFKGISSLLSDITKYRIISDKDGYAAIKISRALFQAFLKYRLTESHVREPNLEEENTLKLVLSYLIEVEEGKTPQLNLPDRTRKATKSVQTTGDNDSGGKKERDISSHSDYYSETRNINNSAVNLETPKDEYFSPHKYTDRPRARSRSPSPYDSRRSKRSVSPSWRSYEDRNIGAKSKRNDFYSQEEDRYHRSARESNLPDRENGRSERRHRELNSPYDENRRRSAGVREDFTSVKIIDGCKISRVTRIREVVENIRNKTSSRVSAIDYMSRDNEPEARRNSSNESFSMKVKTASTLSQARNVAATKLGLYTDLAKSAYRK